MQGGDGRKKLGNWGESVAATHLEAKGYRILQRNWRCARGEIDLVAQAGDVLVFVEVKTRRGRKSGTPEEGVTPRKAQRLLDLGQHYLYEHDLDDVEWRIDLVAVELDGRGKLLRCEHIPNAVMGW
ncbi:MAG: YraN family protein [Anaerolineales bacterium]|nr:YraN family protein [Anaerolineales bacterium]